MAQSHVLSQLKPMKQTIFTCSRKYLCLNKLPSTYSNPKQSINLNQLNDKESHIKHTESNMPEGEEGLAFVHK